MSEYASNSNGSAHGQLPEVPRGGGGGGAWRVIAMEVYKCLIAMVIVVVP